MPFRSRLLHYTAMVSLLRDLLGHGGENGVTTLVIVFADEMPNYAASSIPKCSIAA
jgi:hypothetical protein